MPPALAAGKKPGLNPPPNPDQRHSAVIQPLTALLEQIEQVLHGLSNAQYVRQPVGGIASSVGGHTRHMLDFVQALLHAAESGTLDYEQRKRGTLIETDRAAALTAAQALRCALTALPAHVLDQPVRVTMLLSSADPPVEFVSNFAREAAYVIAHTIHHNALIAVAVGALGGPTPARFGYAPATIAYLDQQPCVR